MGSLVERNRSLWVATTRETDYAPLAGDVRGDVVVIGVGITGLTPSLLLKRSDMRVAVIEAGRVRPSHNILEPELDPPLSTMTWVVM
jgi:hypothetical protein